MPVNCVVYGCFTTGKIDGITYHRFPKNPKQRRKWTNAVNRKNWEPTIYSRICSSHFREADMDRTSLSCTRIREGAVPSIFPAFLQNPKPNRRKQPLSVEPSSEDGLKSAQKTQPEECLSEPGNELVSEPGPSSQVHPFTFVDVVCADDESPKRIKQEVPDSEDEDLLSNVQVKMELDEEEYDSKTFLSTNLHISDVISLSADSSIPNRKLADNDDVNTKFGEHVAESLRALTHDSSREKLKTLINNAIQVVIKSDQLLSKS